jgi:type II secretory pathway pseudopilin PulG
VKNNTTIIRCREGAQRCGLPTVPRAAFTLVEVLVVMTLLSFIVIALMGVFNSTQAAFRASLTQTDVLESGRAAMNLITGDLRAMSPSLGGSNGAVNFYAGNNSVQLGSGATPLIQPLIASSKSRTNVLQNFFILSRENQTWTGTGYFVNPTATNAINPLYRFSMSMSASAFNSPAQLYTNFLNAALTNQQYWSRLVDGVVTLRVRAYNPDGVWLTDGYFTRPSGLVKNVRFAPADWGEVGFTMYSNALPAAVEIELATLEDRTLQRAESRPMGPLRNQYLAEQSSKVHIFRQRVAIPNVDPAAYP